MKFITAFIFQLFMILPCVSAESIEVEAYTDYYAIPGNKGDTITVHGDNTGEVLCILDEETFFNTGANTKITLSGKTSVMPAIRHLCSRTAEEKFPLSENIALRKKYTMLQKPNYPLCSDATDLTALTDGVKIREGRGMFWTQKEVVGWMSPHKMVNIVIDLEKVEPIAGVGFGMGAGISGVNWPDHAFVSVSDDGKKWKLAGDLISLSSESGLLPRYGTYSIRNIFSRQLNTKGRYVQLAVISSHQGSMVFIDEIEIWRGKEELLRKDTPGGIIQDVSSLILPPSRFLALQRRLRSDADSLQSNLRTLKMDEASRKQLSQRIEQTYQSVTRTGIDHKIKKAVFPLDRNHEKLLGENALLLKRAGFHDLAIWKSDRWANTSITAIPDQKKSSQVFLHIEMLRNEVRAESINLTNPFSETIHLKVGIKGIALPFSLYKVVVTESTSGNAAGSALLPLDKSTISIPPGCTGQIWISCEKPAGKPGTYSGMLEFTGKGIRRTVPFSVKLHAPVLTGKDALLLGGWDYMIGDCNYHGNAAAGNKKMDFMRKYGVNTAWAHAGILPAGAKYDADGRLLNPEQMDWHLLREWFTRWRGARKYCIFVDTRFNRFGEKTGSPRFKRMVGDYFNAICRFAEQSGIRRSQLVLELIDEPSSESAKEQILPYLRAIKEAGSGVDIFENPLLIDQMIKHSPEIFQESDIICFDLPLTYRQKGLIAEHLNIIDHVGKSGKTVWFYGCSGPAAELDPVSYYRGLSWYAAKYNAKGIMFWAFGSTGGSGSSWNPYDAKAAAYSPFFVDDESVHTTKQMEAIREGMYDYEYILSARKKIAELKNAGKTAEAAEGERVLEQQFANIISHDIQKFDWNSRSRSVDKPEKARLSVLHWLVKTWEPSDRSNVKIQTKPVGNAAD